MEGKPKKKKKWIKAKEAKEKPAPKSKSDRIAAMYGKKNGA